MSEFSTRAKELQKFAKEHSDPLDLTRRIFLEEPSRSDKPKRDSEYRIKSDLARVFMVEYHDIFFCGSAHLGISPVKGSTFTPGISDLDIAIISPVAFSAAFEDLASSSRSFTNETAFVGRSSREIQLIKQRLWKRGSIHLDDLPPSPWSRSKLKELRNLSEQHRSQFSSISAAFYLSDYFYCWKQKSAIDTLTAIKA